MIREANTPGKRTIRTWVQGALVAGILAAVNVVAGMSFVGEVDWKVLAITVAQAFLTGVVAYFHKSNNDLEGQ